MSQREHYKALLNDFVVKESQVIFEKKSIVEKTEAFAAFFEAWMLMLARLTVSLHIDQSTHGVELILQEIRTAILKMRVSLEQDASLVETVKSMLGNAE